jgi:hypothetical protein
MSSSGSPQADIAGMLSRSEELFEELCRPFDALEEFSRSDRGKAVFALCFVSYEHGLSLRSLISNGYMTSALSLMRLQYEALTRAMWSMYVAPDSAIEKLTASLTLENEQASKSLPSLSQMLEQIRGGIGTKLPQAAFEMLDGFRRARIVQKQNRRRSGGRAVVIAEHSAETLAPMHRLRWRDDRAGLHEPVFEALMITLGVIVRHELRDGVLKRGLSEEDHSVQALGFYGAHKALGKRIQIRRSWRESNEVDALTVERVLTASARQSRMSIAPGACSQRCVARCRIT